jgi:hypothetical protein
MPFSIPAVFRETALPSSLLRFTPKTTTNPLQGDFLPCKLPGEPLVRKHAR